MLCLSSLRRLWTPRREIVSARYLRSLRRVRAPAESDGRVAERINGVPAAVQFERFFEAPTMDADTVVHTLQSLMQERSGDVYLLSALSKRFSAHAEEFFPPQVEDVLGAFASLGFADQSLLRGLAGRIGDVSSDASPRRVVRLLRYGSALRLHPEAWMSEVMPALHRQMPNLRDGLPSVLTSLHGLRWHDPELIELLLTQGLIVSEDLGDAFLARLLEAWSRNGLRSDEAEERLESLAASFSSEEAFKSLDDLRNGLNVLSGLVRCVDAGGDSDTARAAAGELEEKLQARLRTASSEEAAEALIWMRRLSLRSAPLWRVCADAVELALKEKRFVRDLLPDAIHSLASLSSPENAEEAALVTSLLAAPEARAGIARSGARQSMQLLHAASMLALKEDCVSPLASQVARLTGQLSLQQRRVLRTICHAGSPNALQPLVAAVRSLPVTPLPPLLGNGQEASSMSAVNVGSETVLLPKDASKKGGAEGTKRVGIRFLGFGDTLAGSTAPALSPSCLLTNKALEQQGWKVELRAS